MLGSSVYLIAFRILHVMAAIAWGGSLFLLVLFVQPSAAAIGPAGAPFMRELLGKRRLVHAILALAATTILGGAFLYWHDWQLFGGFGDWIDSSFGLWITIGSVAALGAFLIGLLGTRPNVARMLALGARIAQAGDDPSAELVGELQLVQRRLRRFARMSLALVATAAFAMATARYW